MGIEVLDSSSDLSNVILEGAIDSELDDEDEGSEVASFTVDARRRLENKIEELRLMKETQEFDFDF